MIHIDFETRSAVDIRDSGADVYARSLTTDVICMAYAFGDSPVELWKAGDPLPFDLFLEIEGGSEVFAHNAPFELAIWEHVCHRRYGWPKLKPEQTFCTMAMAYAMALPGSLEKASAALGIEAQKDLQGGRIMLQISQPREIKPDGTIVWWDDPAKFERVYAYCRQDVEVEREIRRRVMALSPSERNTWLLDYRINQRGVAVDLKAVKLAIEIVKGEKKRLDAQIREVTNNAVGTCTSTGQLTDWIRLNGVETDGVAKSDVIALLEKELPPAVRSALLLRQEAAKSSTAKFESMLNSACEDGRIRGIFQYHGAGTGRWAGRRIQPQNFPRPSIKQEQIDDVFQTLGAVS